MDITNTANAANSSLTSRNIYCVCYPKRDGLDCLKEELTEAKKKFFTEGKHSVKAENAQIIKGFEGKLQGKLTRHGLYWKKSAGGVILEEAFDQRQGYMVVRRDFRNVIISRTFFNRDHRWIRSEYYEPWDTVTPRLTFKPQETTNCVLRVERAPDGMAPRSTELFPIPYHAGSAEQSIVNAKFGEPGLVISTEEGDFCYCPKKEARGRLRTLEEIKEGSIVLMPAWEVREGTLARSPGEEDASLSFTTLEEYARVEPDGETVTPLAPSPAPPTAEEDVFSPGKEPDPEAAVDQLILEAARKAAASENAQERTESPKETETEEKAKKENLIAAEPLDKSQLERPEDAAAESRIQTIRNGKLVSSAGKAQTSKVDDPLYRGETRNGKRDGFGSAYYSSGALSYAGFWKDGKKNGLGVSFRESDHVLHIAKWENGKPLNPISLFDKEGNLRYSGQFQNGKKQGAGVSFRPEDGTIFVGKWENGVPVDFGSSFDKDGNLLYHGGWKDGKRSGRGTEFDSKGGILFDGEWKDGSYYNGVLYQKSSREKQ